jgi:hypothetical protein
MAPAVAVTDGSFSWTDKSLSPAISNVNINVTRGKLVAVVGHVRFSKKKFESLYFLFCLLMSASPLAISKDFSNVG